MGRAVMWQARAHERQALDLESLRCLDQCTSYLEVHTKYSDKPFGLSNSIHAGLRIPSLGIMVGG